MKRKNVFGAFAFNMGGWGGGGGGVSHSWWVNGSSLFELIICNDDLGLG